MLPIGAVGIFAAAEIDAIAEAERFRDRQRTVQFEPIAAEAVAIEQERLPCFIRRAPEREIDNPARRGERIALRRQSHLHAHRIGERSEEHTSELQSLMRISYAVFCLQKKKYQILHNHTYDNLPRTHTNYISIIRH